ACRALRSQINHYEGAFQQEYGRTPRGRERTPLVSTYAQYKSWKQIIRDDAATQLQSVYRGHRARKSSPEVPRLLRHSSGVGMSSTSSTTQPSPPSHHSWHQGGSLQQQPLLGKGTEAGPIAGDPLPQLAGSGTGPKGRDVNGTESVGLTGDTRVLVGVGATSGLMGLAAGPRVGGGAGALVGVGVDTRGAWQEESGRGTGGVMMPNPGTGNVIRSKVSDIRPQSPSFTSVKLTAEQLMAVQLAGRSGKSSGAGAGSVVRGKGQGLGHGIHSQSGSQLNMNLSPGQGQWNHPGGLWHSPEEEGGKEGMGHPDAATRLVAGAGAG
ncbi:unnamed protein product, partial [Choristocarpus tenellus]